MGSVGGNSSYSSIGTVQGAPELDSLWTLRLNAQDCINEFRVMDGLEAYPSYSMLIMDLQGDKDERRALEMLCGPNGYTVYKLMLLRRNNFRRRLKRFLILLIGRHWVDWL